MGEGAIAWRGALIAAVAFPDAAPGRALARLARRFPGAGTSAPPAAVADVVADIERLFRGARVAFDGVSLDMADAPAFDRDVWKETRAIPFGETRSYGDIARALGDVGMARRVGQALGRNPFPVIVPCHRVVGQNGRMTGFSAPGGAAVKEALLKIEGALAPSLFD